MQNRLTIACASAHHSHVPAQSGAGFGDPTYSRRNAPTRRFFVASCPAYGGVQWEAYGPAGFLEYRFANPLHPAAHGLATVRGGSNLSRNPTMAHHAQGASARTCTISHTSRFSFRPSGWLHVSSTDLDIFAAFVAGVVLSTCAFMAVEVLR
ncbi:hypothetical protein [Frateuria aurantia]|uniref:Uncharacterized protein n=1 Tax=Frateuria aurantia (strain ATCC 33424 / DSM 6220 / KCTC 2777 / LMG 1558 / NBRC 3245 / NCIMB 13370) TaxID=767434 RepID=H8L1V8_FRAAD|nr:hypothetical protein [Frateuria aurantia]AFC86369.1 hypothetical protein Fraau_1982 [Frateuria aurantia DSM 6220]